MRRCTNAHADAQMLLHTFVYAPLDCDERIKMKTKDRGSRNPCGYIKALQTGGSAHCCTANGLSQRYYT